MVCYGISGVVNWRMRVEHGDRLLDYIVSELATLFVKLSKCKSNLENI